jgi:hypothetical protein
MLLNSRGILICAKAVQCMKGADPQRAVSSSFRDLIQDD